MRVSWSIALASVVSLLPAGAGGKPPATRRPVLALTPAESFGFSAALVAPSLGSRPSRELRRELRRVKRALSPVCRKGCGQVWLVVDETMAAAGQLRPGHGFSTIAINPRNLSGWRFAFPKHATLLVLAHEYGHHLDSLNRLGGIGQRDPWPKELLADVVAGCALARAGMSRAELRLGMARVRVTEFEWHQGHPHGADVSRALAAGYDRCLPRRAPTLRDLSGSTKPAWQVLRPGPWLDPGPAVGFKISGTAPGLD